MGKRRRIIKRLFVVIILLITVVFFFLFYQTSVTRVVDDYTYDLPFEKGEEHRVVQGYGGLFSHTHIPALDFSMPVGTKVCAARSGTVYSFRDDSNESGYTARYRNKANYLIIRHDDGSFGCYWHLKENGVLVKKGRVSKGQVVALSGATGLVIRPHLHFSVKRKLSYDPQSFVKTKFNTSKGVVFLTTWKTYWKP